MASVLMAAFIFSLMLNLALFSAYGTYFQTTEGPQEQYHSGSKTARKKVAILTASATIMPPFTERIIETIQKAAEDDDVIGAVLVVDSPGGSSPTAIRFIMNLHSWPEEAPVCTNETHRGVGGILHCHGGGRSGKSVRGADHLDRIDRGDHSSL
ncbi:MAG: hypothetical protein R3C12_24755 [Planctomycetaceae bacterium]